MLGLLLFTRVSLRDAWRCSSIFAPSSSGELYLGVAVLLLERRRLLIDRAASTGVLEYELSSDIVVVAFINIEVKV